MHPKSLGVAQRARVSGHILFARFGLVFFLLPLLDRAEYGGLKTFLFSELRSLRASASRVSSENQDRVFWNFLQAFFDILQRNVDGALDCPLLKL
jgi:hypothetical protein